MKRTSIVTAAIAALVLLFALAAPAATVNCSAVPAWAPNTSYTAGQLVTYSGSEYKCIQSHTSLTGWEPPNVQALWGLQGTCSTGPTPTPTPTVKPPTPTPTATVKPTPTPTPNCILGPPPAPMASNITSTSVALSSVVFDPIPQCSVPTYNWYANGTLLGSSSGASFTATGLKPSTTYSITEAIVTTAGVGPQGPATTVTTLAAATPTPTTKPTATPTPTAKPTPTPTATPNGNCATPWSYPVTYAVGDMVSYSGTNYKCIFAHTSNVSWTPPATPTLWQSTGSCTAGPTPTPTPTPKGTPTATPCASCGGGSLPKHVLEGYWQDFTNGATPLSIASVPTTYDIIAVAFANATTTPGAVDFSIDSGLASALGGYSTSQFINDINTAHSRGQKVIISVGGQNGTISVSDSTSASNFANSVHSLMTTYGFDGVDIDLENGINAQFMTSALQQLASMSSNLIVTTAPQTIDMQSTGSDYFALALDASSVITISNTQYYNSGTMNGCDGNVYSESTENFLTALACIQLKGGIPANAVGLGLPASPSGAGSGYVSPSVVVSALDCLAKGTSCGSFNPGQTWPSLRGAMDWSINWDAANGYNFANTVKPALTALP